MKVLRALPLREGLMPHRLFGSDGACIAPLAGQTWTLDQGLRCIRVERDGALVALVPIDACQHIELAQAEKLVEKPAEKKGARR